MVEVEIHLYGALTKIAKKNKVLVDASNLDGALQSLTKIDEELEDRLFDEDKNLRRFINIYINGKDFRFLDKLQTVLSEGDSISLMPAVSGG